MDTERFNAEHAEKSRAVCERIEREDAERRSKLADLMDVQLKGELGRARAEADGWRGVADRRLKHIEECESALKKRNARIAELEKQVADLRAELANAEVPTERERRILDIWPHYEDGEPVMIGDEVNGLGGEIVEVYITENETAIWNSCANHMHLRPGEAFKRPAPEVLDADGVEIKVGDTVWDNDGVEMTVTSLVGELPGHVTAHGDNPPATYSISPKRLTHTRPDSWERLEEDAGDNPFTYCKAAGIHLYTFDNSERAKSRDIIRRAKALAGVEVERDAD